jgi:hypothetical protein
MRLIYKLLKKQLQLLDSVKNGNGYYGYSMNQASGSYRCEDVEYLEQKNLIEIKPDVEWGYVKLYSTVSDNNLRKTILESEKPGAEHLHIWRSYLFRF